MHTSSPTCLLVALLCGCEGCPPLETDTADSDLRVCQLDCDDPSPCVPRGEISWSPTELPNVLFVVDRSASMGGTVDIGGEKVVKLDVARGLAESVLPDIARSMRSGLVLVPPTVGTGCAEPVSDLQLDFHDTLASDLSIRLAGVGAPQTPLSAALALAHDGVGLGCDFAVPDRDAIVIVVSDGLGLCSEGCDLEDGACQTEALVGSANCLLLQDCCNVELYVVYVGDGDPPEALSQLAAASVEAGTLPPALYQATTSVEELVHRLDDQIKARGSRCQFALVLGGDSIEPDELVVWVEGFDVPWCPSGDCDEGWTLDADTAVVTLLAETCRSIANPGCPDVRFSRR